MSNLDLITEDLDNRFALEMAGEKDQESMEIALSNAEDALKEAFNAESTGD